MLKPSYHDAKCLKHLPSTGIEESYFYRQLSSRLSSEDKERLDDLLKRTFIAGYNAGEADENKRVLEDLKQFC